MLFTLKPMLFRWLLCFSHRNQCVFVGSYAFCIQTFAFLLVPTSFVCKTMCFRLFLCRVYNKANVFSLAPMLFHANHCFFVVSCALHNKTCICVVGSYGYYMKNLYFLVVSYVFHMKAKAFSLVRFFLL